MPKTPEQIAREAIDRRLIDAGWVIQDMNKINLSAALGVAIREFPTSTGPVDYALFVAGKPVGVVEAKKDTEAQNITVVEGQSFRYANSTFKYLDEGYEIRFAYEATGTLMRFTDFHDIKYRSRSVFSFHQPEMLQDWIAAPDTVRNNQKHLPELDEFETKVGKPINIVAENLLNAFDKDVVAARAGVVLDPDREPTPEDQVKLDAAQEELIKEAERPFNNPDNRDYIEDVRKKHDQIIDNVNIDSVTYAV